MLQTHMQQLNDRKKLKAERLELRNEVIALVGKDVYDTVTENQRKMAQSSFVLEAVNDAIDDDPLDTSSTIVVGIQESIALSIDYFDWDKEFVSPKAIAEMITDFINQLDESNVKLLGDNLNEFIRITDAMSNISTSEMLIKMNMNSHYGNS